MQYDGILLDFYGTLVEEDDAVIDRIVSSIANLAPCTVDRQSIAKAWGRRFANCCAEAHGASFRCQRVLERESLQDLLAAFACDLDAEVLSHELFRFWQAPPAYPETAAFLSRLQVPVCIVSNIDRDDLEAALSHHGWHFECIVTSECCRAYKPRPEMFDAAMSMLGLPPDRLVHIGDSWGSDVVGASQRGVEVAWVNRRNKTLPINAAHRPTITVQNLTELAARFDP